MLINFFKKKGRKRERDFFFVLDIIFMLFLVKRKVVPDQDYYAISNNAP